MKNIAKLFRKLRVLTSLMTPMNRLYGKHEDLLDAQCAKKKAQKEDIL